MWKHGGDFLCLNCFQLEYHKKFKNKDSCGVIMAFEDTKMSDFNMHRKSDKTPLLFLQILNLWLKE